MTALTQGIERIRSELDRDKPITQRCLAFWVAITVGRELAASDVVREQFRKLAVDSGLQADLNRHPPYDGEATIKHLIKWGLLGRDPFGKQLT